MSYHYYGGGSWEIHQGSTLKGSVASTPPISIAHCHGSGSRLPSRACNDLS